MDESCAVTSCASRRARSPMPGGCRQLSRCHRPCPEQHGRRVQGCLGLGVWSRGLSRVKGVGFVCQLSASCRRGFADLELAEEQLAKKHLLLVRLRVQAT